MDNDDPSPSTVGQLLTVSEVSAILRAHPNSVRKWADIGLLPAFRIGRRGDRRFRVEDVAEFLQAWNNRGH